jgi:3,4-dihydroxy 2-butanone 4-phosphate synthase/GTP cyclohydrolase II
VELLSRTFTSVPELVEELRAGRMIVLVDDEDRENEGDFVIAAEHLTVEHVVAMNRLASGIITVPMPAAWLQRLHLPPMVGDNAESMRTAFTVTVDAKEQVTTGSSAHDRVATIRRLADPTAGPDDFVRPGHVNPLRVREGGVLRRTGHTEASHDLMVMAGLSPVAVLCEIMGDDGEMLRLPELRAVARDQGLALGSIADVIAHRLLHERLASRIDSRALATRWGPLVSHRYRSNVDDVRYTALVLGELEPEQPVVARMHSASLTDDLFGMLGDGQPCVLQRALDRIAEEGRGVLVYIERHGGSPSQLMDERMYGIGAQILRDLGAQRLRLLTDHPRRLAGLHGFGLEVVEFVPLLGSDVLRLPGS